MCSTRLEYHRTHPEAIRSDQPTRPPKGPNTTTHHHRRMGRATPSFVDPADRTHLQHQLSGVIEVVWDTDTSETRRKSLHFKRSAVKTSIRNRDLPGLIWKMRRCTLCDVTTLSFTLVGSSCRLFPYFSDLCLSARSTTGES
jgi:hypothetical protein